MKKQKTNGFPPEANLYLNALRGKTVQPLGALTVHVAVTPEPVDYPGRTGLSYRRVRPGEVWAKHVYDCGWFHVTGDLPENALTDDAVMLQLRIGGEGLVYTNGGEPFEMISAKVIPADNLTVERGKSIVPLTGALTKDGRIDFYMDAGFNGSLFNAPFGVGIFRCAKVVRADPKQYAFYYDFLTGLSLYASLPRGEGTDLLSALKQAYRTALAGDPEEARAVLATALSGGPTDFTLYAVGHSHLDLAWLWPVRETKRKAARTFTKQLNLMGRYPDYIYGASQPWQFEYLRDNVPAVWDRIESAVRSGRLEPQGGMYVEADTNLSGGEALIRQFYYGKRFWRETFGMETRLCWLPDVFGYNGNLPQIMRGCGIDRFFTIKLSWNEHNRFPYRSFNWAGIDGSEVLVHMAPDETYTSDALPASTRHAYENYSEKDVSGEAMYVYGVGDGGGGPSEGFLELLNRQKTLRDTPKVVFSTAERFFDKLETYRDALPRYRGELYLEKHQGTYTTQAKNKRANRRTEYALEDAESLCAAAYLQGRPYPQEKLDRWWKEALLYQFHDIIPGSSIGRVYRESLAGYDNVLAEITDEQRDALRYLCGEGDQPLSYDPLAFSAAPPVPAKEDDALLATDDFLRNRYLTVRFLPNGEILSLRGADGTEYSAGYLNRLKLFFDKPLMFNAWDIDWKYHDRKGLTLHAVAHEIKVTDSSVTRVNRYRHGKTTVTQEITLEANADCLKIRTVADWHETFQMLRAEFLPAVQSGEVACDIQFGTIFRSTGDKTPEEQAQFEICAHKYVDVSDESKGFSLLNDCKYGHRVKEGLLSLNLLRSPVFPDPHADRGAQECVYEIYPHRGPLSRETLSRAFRLNKPALPFRGEHGFDAPVSVDNPDVVITLLKKAYDENAVVVRLYESQGKPANAALTVRFGYTAAFETNLLEENAVPAAPARLTFRPFEIKTLKFTL